jgi:hypothetical protein
LPRISAFAYDVEIRPVDGMLLLPLHNRSPAVPATCLSRHTMGCKLLPVFLYISAAWLIAARMDFVLKSIHAERFDRK